MTPGEPDLVAELRSAGCVFAEDEAAVLIASAGSPGELRDLVAARVAGQPLEHVVGWVEFDGLRLAVRPGVFVPRQRTILLARQAVALAAELPGSPLVVELCCGAGAVGALVHQRVPRARLLAGDIDPAAAACARLNLPGIDVVGGDLFELLPATLAGRIDVLAANAPYVPTQEIAFMPPEARDHEPLVALDGGEDGTSLHARLASGARRWLAPGGWLLIEAGRRQAARTVRLLDEAGLETDIVTDDDLDATIVRGRSPRS